MSRCGECKLGCNEEGTLYCEENLGYEQCIDRLQDALYAVGRLQKAIAQITFDEEKLREIVKEAVERFKEEYEITDRPQGEWIDAEIPLESGGSMPIQVCNLCKTFYPLAYTGGGHRFCPNCGARMKGADDED